MKSACSLSLSALVLAGLAGSAAGQVSPVGPFTGTFSEGFNLQTIVNVFPVCVEDRVFSNTADLCAPSGSAHITGGWGFECSIGPNFTPRLMASTGGAAVYTFDAPITRFGGYFGTNFNNNVTSGASATFFDEANNQIGSPQTVNIDACGTYRWNGWASTTPVKRIEILGLGAGSGGGYIMMDDMEYDRGNITLGACCLTNGSCVLNTATGCAAQNGIYRGDNSVCATANCPQPPTGACCKFDGTCSILTQAQCTAANSVYRGDNTTCAAANCPVTGCVENGDAGDLPSTAQVCPGSGAMTRIDGFLDDSDADMFEINICSPASFGATTVGGALWDTQLFLFKADGTGVAFNDDSVGVQSTLTSLFTSSLPAGRYYLAISGYDRDAVDAGVLELWLDGPFAAERAPDGPGAANPVRSWDGAGGGGAYSIFLQGTCFPGAATCYANCDGSSVPPILNVSDFICFQTKYAAGDSYANCDNSTTPPVLNVSDFICFQTKYAAGCS